MITTDYSWHAAGQPLQLMAYATMIRYAAAFSMLPYVTVLHVSQLLRLPWPVDLHYFGPH